MKTHVLYGKSGIVLLLLLLLSCGGGSGGFLGLGGGLAAIATFASSGAVQTGVAPVIFTQDPVRVKYLPPTIEFSSDLVGMAATADFKKIYALDRAHNAVSVFDMDGRTVIKILHLGAEPRIIAISPSGQRAIVTAGESRIFVIDTGSDTVSEVDQSLHPTSEPFTAAITPSDTKAYVGDGDGLAIVDLGTSPPTVLGSIPGCNRPRGMATRKEPTERLYVACQADNKLVEIDPQADTVLRELSVDTNPTGLDLTPDENLLFVASAGADGGNGSVSIVDTNTLTEETRINNVVAGPKQVLVSSDGKRAFVVGTGEPGRIRCTNNDPGLDPGRISGISVLDVEARVSLFQTPELDAVSGLAATGDGTRVFGFSGCSRELYRVSEDDTIFTLKTKIFEDKPETPDTNFAGIGSSGISLNEAGSELYLLHRAALSIVDPETLDVMEMISGRGAGPMRLALSQDGATLFASLSGRNEVVGVGTTGGQVTWRQRVGLRPFSVSVGPLSGSVYVANPGFYSTPDDRVFQIDAATGNILQEKADPSFEGPVMIEAVSEMNNEFVLVGSAGDFTDVLAGNGSINKRGIISQWDPGNSAEILTEVVSFPNGFQDDEENKNNISDFQVRVLNGNYSGLAASAVSSNNCADGRGDKDLTLFPTLPEPSSFFPSGKREVCSVAFVALNRNATRGAASSFEVNSDGQHFVTLFDISAVNTLQSVIVDAPNPGDIEFSPDGQSVFVAAYNGNAVELVDYKSAVNLGEIPVGYRPIKITVNDQRNEIMVANYFSNTVTVIDANGSAGTAAVLGTLPTGAGPVDLVLNDTGDRAYVANSLAETVTVLEATDNGSNCAGGWCVVDTFQLSP